MSYKMQTVSTPRARNLPQRSQRQHAAIGMAADGWGRHSGRATHLHRTEERVPLVLREQRRHALHEHRVCGINSSPVKIHII